MIKQVCKYSIIRFQPYVETEEFANIGIVLYGLQTKQLLFKLRSPKEHERITQFFKPLNKDIYTQTIHIVESELKRIQRIMKNTAAEMDFYDDLIRPQEGIIQYSNNRARFSTDLDETLNELFEYYVKRGFAHAETHEETMRKRIRDLLVEYNFADKYRSSYLGDDGKYKVNFPFVNQQSNSAIKPIHFTHPDSNQLIDHGLSWLAKVRQLTRYNYIKPEQVLFSYRPPKSNCGILFEAFRDVKAQIETAGILMADINDSEAIKSFVHKYVS